VVMYEFENANDVCYVARTHLEIFDLNEHHSETEF
jgi:hypothetical protein